MKDRFILNKFSNRILHIGLALAALGYLAVMLHIHRTIAQGVVLTTDVYTMIEHVSASLMLTVGAALLLDIHIKREK